MTMVIRKAKSDDAKALAEIMVETWNHTYRGLISDDYLDSLDKEKSESTWKQMIKNDRHILLVAEIGESGEVVGFACGGRNRKQEYSYDGELYALYVLPDYHTNKVGTHLVNKFVEQLIVEGYSSMSVWHVKGNSVNYFYEKLGGKYIDTSKIEIAGQEYEIIGYGFGKLKIDRSISLYNRTL